MKQFFFPIKLFSFWQQSLSNLFIQTLKLTQNSCLQSCHKLQLPFSNYRIRMALWDNLFDEINLHFFDYISQGHAFLINSILQSFFFTMAIIQIISWLLNKLNLFFARDFNRHNGTIKIIICILFCYLKIWSKYSAYMQILGYFCSVSVCIQLYGGCIRMGKHFCLRLSKNSFGNVSSLISILLIFLSYKVFTLSHAEQEENKYPYVALYLLIFGFILLMTILRGKQLIYILIIMTTTASIIMLRSWSLQLLKETFLCKVSLPLESVIYLLFAVQQSYKSRQAEVIQERHNQQFQNKGNNIRPSQWFLAQMYYFAFFLINKRMYNIQIVFATVCVLNYLGTSKLN